MTMTEPLRIAIVGHTNAGKTSLLRTLTRQVDFGKVSDRPGTTRHAEAIDLRLRNARREMEQKDRYRHVIVNDDLSRAYDDIRAILRTERLKRFRQTGLDRFVDGLLTEG